MNARALSTWLCATVAALLMAAAPAWLDLPTTTYASYGYTPATLNEAQAERLDAQARAICTATHGPEGATARQPDGSVRCTNKHGRSAITVLSHQQHPHHPTGGIRP